MKLLARFMCAAGCLLLCSLSLSAQSRMNAGTLSKGEKVVFEKVSGGWGITVSGADGRVLMQQNRPLRLSTTDASGAVKQAEAAYTTVTAQGRDYVAQGEIKSGGATFRFTDVWSLDGAQLRFRRSVAPSASKEGGFATEVAFQLRRDAAFPDIKLFIPGESVGNPEFLSARAPAGKTNYEAGHVSLREEACPIPLFGIWYDDRSAISMLDPTPHGNTTEAEGNMRTAGALTDERFTFGLLGANNAEGGGVALSFAYPGGQQGRGRFHPIRPGIAHEYDLVLRFSYDQDFHEYYREAWRWGWNTLNPKIKHYDMAVVEKSLIEHLRGLVYSKEDRTGIPFWTSMVTGKNFGDAGLRDRDAIMGFVGKDLEGAAMLLFKSYEETGAVAEDYYNTAVDIINSMVKYVEVSPPSGEGFNIDTGKPSLTNSFPNHVPCCNGRMYLRAFTDDMRWLLNAYQWELARGREHYDWWRWCVEFAEWLIWQQKSDGSFPRSWYPGTDKIYDDNYQCSYNAMAFMVKVDEVTGDDFWISHGGSRPFLRSAQRAGDFVWDTYESKEAWVGGTIDNNNIQDKEAGTLSLEGFLALYEATGEQKWLDRAKAAADYAETFIYAWDVPMPEDAKDADLHWKKGASTIGVNKITIGATGVDQWMAGDVDEYVRLYKYTGDEHYKRIAAVLMHGTKSMVALPGRQYDLYEPGAQQEHWQLLNNRGRGRHRGALPWVTVNHITGIYGVKALDKALYEELAATKE